MLKKLLAAAAVSATIVMPAQAQNGDDVCGAYSAIGKVMASEMLGLTLQDIIDMQRGQRPDLMGKITQAIAGAWTPAEIAAVTSLTTEEQSLLGEAAGAYGLNLLMAGRATTAQQVRDTLMSECKATGYQKVVSNQRQMKNLALVGQN